MTQTLPTPVQGLVDGYRTFRRTGWQKERSRWAELSEGQSPRVMVIACSDSRVDPAQIFNTRPGEIFVVRNVAALVPPFERGGTYHGVSAALEFAVTQLKVEAIMVMGHGACGGCQAALARVFDDADLGEGGFIHRWIQMLNGARERVMALCETDDPQAQTMMEQEGVKTSLANLRSFSFVADREKSGDLTLHGGHFAVENGRLYILDEDSGAFSEA